MAMASRNASNGGWKLSAPRRSVMSSSVTHRSGLGFLRPCAFRNPLFPQSLTTFPMIAPETFNHIENIKKRAGHLWRFL